MGLKSNQALTISDLCVDISSGAKSSVANNAHIKYGTGISTIGYHQFAKLEITNNSYNVQSSSAGNYIGILFNDYNTYDKTSLPCKYLYITRICFKLTNTSTSGIYRISGFRVVSSDDAVIGQVNSTFTLSGDDTSYFEISDGILDVENRFWIKSPSLGLKTSQSTIPSLSIEALSAKDIGYKISGSRSISNSYMYFDVDVDTWGNSNIHLISNETTDTAVVPPSNYKALYCVVRIPTASECRYLYIDNLQFYPKNTTVNIYNMTVYYSILDTNNSIIIGDTNTGVSLSKRQYQKFTINDGILDLKDKKWIKSPSITRGTIYSD
jgi:hypothetical protein